MGYILCLGKAMAPPSHINTKPHRNINVTLTSYQHQQKSSDIQTSRIQINAGMSCIIEQHEAYNGGGSSKRTTELATYGFNVLMFVLMFN